jgi:hypothetical protein
MNTQNKYNQEKVYRTSCQVIIFSIVLIYFFVAVYQAGCFISEAYRPFFFNQTTRTNER